MREGPERDSGNPEEPVVGRSSRLERCGGRRIHFPGPPCRITTGVAASNNRNLLSPSPGGQESKTRVFSQPHSLQRLYGRALPAAQISASAGSGRCLWLRPPVSAPAFI